MTQAPPLRTASDKAHNLPLDSVRGIAALCIVVHHFVISDTFGRIFDFSGPISSFFWNSWIFVDLFFVLSGIVMAMNYARPVGPFSIGDFMVRRLARIYPLHLAMLLILLPLRTIRIVSSAAGLPVVSTLAHEVNTPFAFLMHLFLLNALGTVGSLSWNGPSWSISAEFYTYMVFAGVIAVLAAHRRLALAGQVFAVLSLSAMLAVIFVLGERSLEFHYEFGILRCLYSFALGVATFKLVEAYRGRLAGPFGGSAQWALTATIVILVGGVGTHGWLSFGAPVVFALFLAALLVDGRTALGRLLSLPPLVWLGQRSYSVYMIHSTIIVTAEYACRAAGIERLRALDDVVHGGLCLASLLTLIAVVLLLSDVTLRYIEKPGSRFVLSLYGRLRDLRRTGGLAVPERGLHDRHVRDNHVQERR